ncbi:Putative motility protein [Desulfosporosinus hippei DSM 8344]|uniref:Putative motility protein n=1 Tax=Desulfosporosinus hippei DSM 8344 TaxID=1121419 RepID=A0A1G8FZI6_9FIRM|nr:Putative motility protein [Desulfosporosinus hippei DSM 8344]
MNKAELFGLMLINCYKEGSNLDIAAMSIILNQNKVQEQSSLAVMKMAMDVAANQNESIIAMDGGMTKAMETSIQPFLGANLDIKA